MVKTKPVRNKLVTSKGFSVLKWQSQRRTPHGKMADISKMWDSVLYSDQGYPRPVALCLG